MQLAPNSINQRTLVVRAKPKKKGKPRSRSLRAGVMSVQKSLNESSQSNQLEVAPVAVRRRLKLPKPVYLPTRGTDGRVRIVHREYCFDVNTPSTNQFANVNTGIGFFSINPGSIYLFPWLSSLCTNYTKYIFHKLVFHYETDVSTSTAGSVYLAVDFNASDISIPQNKSAVMSLTGAVRSALWQCCEYATNPVDLKGVVKDRFVRPIPGQVTSATETVDFKLYDVGNLYVFTGNTTSAADVGEIYVEYDVELITPTPVPSPNYNFSASISSATGGTLTTIWQGGVVTGGYPFIINSSGSTLYFGALGQYLIQLSMEGTGFENTIPTFTQNFSTFVNLFGAGNHSADYETTQWTITYAINVTAVNQYLTLDMTPSASTVTLATLRISPYNYLLSG